MPTVPFVGHPLAARVEMVFDYFGQTVMNVFHVTKSTTISSADRTTIANTFHTWWTTNQKPLHVADMKLTLIRVVDLASQTGPSTEVPISPPEAGTSGSTDSVSGSAIVVTHRTAARGRNFRGRTYLAGWPEGQRTNNVDLVLSYITSIITSFGALLTALTTASFQLVVFSKMLNKAWRGTGLPTNVTGFTADTHLDSQRRRLYGRGT